MTSEVFASVWDAIEDTPEEAENMRIRAELMLVIERLIKEQGWTQKEAARHLGVTQPRISDLVRGKIALFSVDSLIAMAGAAGQRVRLDIEPNAREPEFA